MKLSSYKIHRAIMAVLLLVGFVTNVNTVISKAAVQKADVPTQISPSSLIVENIVPKVGEPIIEQKQTIVVVPEITPVVSIKSDYLKSIVSDASGKLSLDQIYVQSLTNQSTSDTTRAKSITPAQKATDLFTQSQAHMSVPEVKKLIDAIYDTKPYSKLIASILDREKEYAADYVFYHGTDNVWRLAQDVYTRLYAHFNKLPADLTKTFVFLRFEDVKAPISFQDFLVTRLKENGLINDHTMGDFIIAANLALFGNVGTDPECSWQYFIKSRGHTNPSRVTYEKMMDSFGLTHKYIDELLSLVKLYQTKEQTILQIFVPKDKINSIGYLAWIRGIPAYQEMIHTVLKSVQDKKFVKTAPALDYYTSLFKGEQEKNPLFKGLMDRVREGEFSLNYFLDFYRNQPNQIEDINNFQARLFITKDVLLNPTSGVKIFRCSTATDAQLKKYNEALDAVIQKILAEKK